MRQKIAAIDHKMDMELEKAYSEGKILLYPYLGNGWM